MSDGRTEEVNLGLEVGVSALVIFDFSLVFPVLSFRSVQLLQKRFHFVILPFELITDHLVL